MSLILSPYFSNNTKLVANFCRKCYLREDEVVVSAVNMKFLKNNDAKYYQVFVNNFFFVTHGEGNEGKFTQQSYKDTNEAEVEQENEKIKNNEGNIKNEIKERGNKTKINKWIPPISPHNLIEEKYYNDPWALLVATIFLNRTSCFLALPYLEKFFEDFKGPYDVSKVEPGDLETYFVKIGLVKTRATQVWRMSRDFVSKDWRSVGELYGVGKYAEDAYRMFHLGDFSVEPTDRYLKIYKGWYEMRGRNEELGIAESNTQVYLEDYQVDEDRTEDDG